MTPAHVGSAPITTKRQRRPVATAYHVDLRCPQCGSKTVRRLHRTWVERIISKVSSTYPHVCRDCATRFYALLAE